MPPAFTRCALSSPCCSPQQRSESSRVFGFLLMPANLSSACAISCFLLPPLAFQPTSTSPDFKPTNWFSPPPLSPHFYIQCWHLDIPDGRSHHHPWDQFWPFWPQRIVRSTKKAISGPNRSYHAPKAQPPTKPRNNKRAAQADEGQLPADVGFFSPSFSLRGQDSEYWMSW